MPPFPSSNSLLSDLYSYSAAYSYSPFTTSNAVKELMEAAERAMALRAETVASGKALFAKVHHLKWSSYHDAWEARDVNGNRLAHMPIHAVEALAKSLGKVVRRDGWDVLWLCLPPSEWDRIRADFIELVR